MKYYDNSIYPIALVLSNDAESVNKYYRNADPNDDEEIKSDCKVLARTMFISRRTEDDCYPMAVGIIFSKNPACSCYGLGTQQDLRVVEKPQRNRLL